MTSTVVSRTGGAKGEPFVDERPAGEAGIKPCFLLKENSGKVYIQDNADALCQTMFALKNLATGGTVASTYLTGETVRYGVYARGQEVTVLIKANAAAIFDGAPLTSAGDGTLKGGTVANAVAYVIGDIDNSSNGAAVQHLARIA